MQYSAPWWLPGGHVQTIWAALCARRRLGPVRALQRERWPTPDGDFVDVDSLPASRPQRPMVVLFHGLEGSSSSHYAQAFADWACEHDVHVVLPHFRGCSGEHNHAARAYHSGDHAEIDWMLRRLRAQHRAQGGRCLVAAGVSLGGNALMRWAGEQGGAAAEQVDAVASICSPLDLGASGRAIGQGINRQLYTRMFLRTLKPKALVKWAQHPTLFSRERLLAARDLYDFDNAFTAPVHGFRDTEDYWARASAKPHMQRIRIPALALNALNDPFVPAHSLPRPQDVSPSVTLWQPRHGGHAGFTQGRWPGHVRALPDRVGAWLLQASQTGQQEDEHG
ncbi:MAG: alpha/beta fold hydrolase [Betaproteobacteria bacterium]|nr:alpha/beta fold hydrolase [Betaproteobacteria bacterium]